MATGDLVVTDLDGTLWRTDDEVHPSTIDAIRQLAREDVPLLVATGRRRGSTRRALARIGALPPAVVMNGALGLELATEERFQSVPFSSDAARVLLAAFRSQALDPCVYLDDPAHEVVVSARPSTHPIHLESLGDSLCVGDLDQVVAAEPVYMFGLIGLPHDALAAVAEQITGEATVNLDRSFDVPGMASITVTPAGLSKWEGVLAWCRHAHYTPTRVIAIGDGPNDVELLTNAHLALVPETAHRAALDTAQHVIPDPEVGGWATVLAHL